MKRVFVVRDVLGVLFGALLHPIRDVRSNAAKALGEIKDLSSVPVLIKLLHDPELEF